ncbi:MAG TPA: type II toxin-antitoxin system VapC family toxin [Acidimicrobiales bacterium]|nr:type II toxin-antitoxin system VapC family toxin [Acidimicrobiales bacterium]
MTAGLADTSVFVARESRRPLDIDALPDELAVSAITIGELRAGVLAASDPLIADRRLSTLQAALGLDPIPVDGRVANAWARLRIELREQGRRLGVNDSWIAATAMAHDLALVTQDDDYDGLDAVAVIKV